MCKNYFLKDKVFYFICVYLLIDSRERGKGAGGWIETKREGERENSEGRDWGLNLKLGSCSDWGSTP